jgi:hypothetical protein
LRVVATGRGEMRVVPRGSPDAPPFTIVDPGLDEQAIADAMEQLSAIVAVDAPVPGAITAGSP